MGEKCCGNPFCEFLDQETKSWLCDHITVTYETPKQIQQNRWNRQLEVVTEGVLVKYMVLQNGGLQFVEILGPGSILGEHNLFKVRDYPEYETIALTKVGRCHLPIQIAEQIYNENKEFAKVLVNSLISQRNQNHTFRLNLQSKNNTEKIEFILSFLSNLGVEEHNITQDILALILGISRVTVSRALHKTRLK